MFHSDDGKSKKAAAAGREDLDAFEFGDEDVDEMSSGAEEVMMDGDDIQDRFLPSEGEGEKGMSVGCVRIWQHLSRLEIPLVL